MKLIYHSYVYEMHNQPTRQIQEPRWLDMEVESYLMYTQTTKWKAKSLGKVQKRILSQRERYFTPLPSCLA